MKLIITALLALFLVASTSASILQRYKFADDSCAGRCNRTGTVPGAPCQCNSACIRYNDCCSDYASLCLGQEGSCVGRCDQSGTVPGTCQCNKPCVDFGDCCPDYSDVCSPSGGISDKELEDLTEQLLNLDTENNATAYISIDIQGKTSSGASNDVAPNPLLTVLPAAFSRSTIEKLNALQDNYVPETNVRESYTPEEEAEMSSFTEAVFNTRVMQTAQEFLQSKNLPVGRDNFHELWFELYTRSGVISSCGFEHVFVGEISSNAVSGFHNWEQFSVQEDNTKVDYKGYMDYIDFGAKGAVIEHRFTWQGKNKPVSSMFIGTSPELELAIYTVCFHARPNAKCPISLNGNKIKIQTYTIGPQGQYVGTAYPDLSD